MADKTNPHDLLRHLAEQRRLIDQQIDDIVAVLRSPGLDGFCDATWESIAIDLGVTRQAVQQRYRHLSWSGGVG